MLVELHLLLVFAHTRVEALLVNIHHDLINTVRYVFKNIFNDLLVLFELSTLDLSSLNISLALGPDDADVLVLDVLHVFNGGIIEFLEKSLLIDIVVLDLCEAFDILVEGAVDSFAILNEVLEFEESWVLSVGWIYLKSEVLYGGVGLLDGENVFVGRRGVGLISE